MAPPRHGRARGRRHERTPLTRPTLIACTAAASILLAAAPAAQLGTLPPSSPGRPGKGASDGQEGAIPFGQALPPNHYAFRGGRVVEISFRRDGTQGERVVPGSEVRRLRRTGGIPPIYATDTLRPTLAVRPRRLAPGERGTLHVVVEVLGDATRPGAVTSFALIPPQPPAVVGQHAVIPVAPAATPGPRPRSIHVQADIEIPPDAVHGGYPVVAMLELEVHDRSTGVLTGVIACEARGTLQIGPSLQPAAGARAGGPTPGTGAGQSDKAPAAAAGRPAKGAGPAARTAPAGRGGRMEAVASDPSADAPAPAPRDLEGPRTGTVLTILGFALAVLLVLAGLARRS